MTSSSVPATLRAPAGSLLSSVSYAAATDGHTFTCTSTSFVDVDAVNLLVPSFVVPASGKVLVRWTAGGLFATSQLFWNVREGSSDVPNSSVIAMVGTGGTPASRTCLITGLTPGAVKSWKWGWKEAGGTAYMDTGPNNGPCVMEVWDASPSGATVVIENEFLHKVGTRLVVFGHSLTAAGGTTKSDRGWEEILAGMLRSEAVQMARGGAVLAWHDRGGVPQTASATTGDGGLAYLLNFLKPNSNLNSTIRWKGLYSAGTTYQVGDGVWDASNFWWVALTVNTGVTPVEGAAWHKITSVNDYGATKWLPMQQITILGYGNNDLGWGKQLAVYTEALRVALCRAMSARLFEANDPTVSYTGAGWGALATSNTPSTGVYLHSSSQIKPISATATDYMEINVPTDFPGGEIDLGFLTYTNTTGRVTVTVDGAAPGGGKMYFAGVDSGATGIINFSNAAHGYSTTGAQQWSEMVIRLTGLAAGNHKIRVTTTSGEAVAWLYFDYWSVMTPSPMTPPVLVSNLVKVLSYAAWTSPLPVDADVDTWNAGVATMLAAEFPTAVTIDLDLAKTVKLFSYDQMHGNDEAHALVAKQVYAKMKSITISEDLAAWLARERHVGVSSGPIVMASWPNPSVAHGSTYVDIISSSTPVQAYVRARPGDQLLLQILAVWSNDPTGMIRCADFCTVDPVLLTRLNYASSGNGTQVSNGISAALHLSDGQYHAVCDPMVPYVVQENDVVRGYVLVKPIVKSLYSGSGTDTASALIITASGNEMIFNVINLGQPAAYRSYPL